MRAVRPLLAGALLVALAGGTGCYQARHAYDGAKLLTTAPGLGADARVVRHFRVHDRQAYLFYGLVPLGPRVNGAALAARAVGTHDGAVNLRLADGQDLLDMFVSNVLCVAGLVCGTWSVWAEGDVVDVVGPPASLWVRAPQAAVPPRRADTAPADVPAAAAPSAPADRALPARREGP